MKNLLASLLVVLGLGVEGEMNTEDVHTSDTEKSSISMMADDIIEGFRTVSKKNNPYQLGDKVKVTFDYKDANGDVHEEQVNVIFRDYETIDPSEKEAPEGTQWIKGRVVLAATIKENDKDNLAFPVVVQGTYPSDLNEEFVDLPYLIGRSSVQQNTFNSVMTHGQVKSGEFEVLVPSGDIEGSTLMLNMGADQVWFEL